MIGWRPFANRNEEPEERVHDFITDDASERIGFAVNEVASRGEIQEAYNEYRISRGRDVDYFVTRNSEPAHASLHKFVTQEDDEEVLTLLELLVNELWTDSNHSREQHSVEELVDLDEKLRQILLEEGVLLKLKPDRETVYEFADALHNHQSDSGGYSSRRSYDPRPSRDWKFEFEWQAHGAVIESDQAVRRLGRQERWEDALNPYNAAWEAYQDPPVSNIVAEKLYNSLEMTLEKICVEEQGWTSKGAGVGAHIDALKDNGLFAPNQSMVHEWTQLTEGLKAGVQKTGGDRKGHEEMDEEYALLLLHQVGAFLSFIISRYEAEYVD